MISQSKIQNPKPKIPLRFVFCLLILSTVLCPLPSEAAPTGRSKHTEVELISEAASIAPGAPFTVALRMKMDPHWHTYWKNPGDSGLATSIRWDLPEGFTAGPIQWPAPKRIETGGLVSYGYEGEIFLLTDITPPAGLKPGQKINLKAHAEWLECEDICVPGGADLSLSQPVSAQPASQNESLFSLARKSLPQALKSPASFEDQGTRIVMRFVPDTKDPVLSAWFYPATEEWVEYGKPQETAPASTPGTWTLHLPKAPNAKGDQISGVLRLDTKQGPVAYEIPPASILRPPPSALRPQSTLLLLGFLGGLILNLMPCVFPVLGIKIMGLVQQSGEARGRAARHGAAYTGGVLASFWALAGALLILRAGGSQLGWGFQLQSPAFVFALTALLLAFGLNMSGVFEIGASLIGTGNSLAGKPSLGGSFFSGVLATVVATPCAAPFLAPALGAALILPAGPALALFTAIALGLALPYLMLSLFPGLAARLPRPGVWMESFKQGLAFLLYGAAGYLLWTLVGQLCESAQLSAILGLVALSAAMWIYGRWSGPAKPARTRLTATILALLLGVGGLALGWPRAIQSGDIIWEPWNAERVAALRQEGRPIYVDFTARWCATCQVNKKVVFGSSEVKKKFRDRNVATLKGDWTNQDPAITAELARWNRSAVPFNLLYLPDRTDPVVLPELLTPGIVMDALEKPPKP